MQNKSTANPRTIAFYRANKLGDNVVAIPALYLAKCLFAGARLVLLTNKMGENLCRNYDFIDKIVLCDEQNLPQIVDEINADVLILSHRTGELIRLAKQSKCPKIATWLHLSSLFCPRFRHPRYLTKSKRLELRCCIDLVRCINARLFDEKFSEISLKNLPIKIQTSPQNAAFVNKFMHAFKAGNYKKIIGINALSSDIDKDFKPEIFIELGRNLAREFGDFLFVFINFERSGYEFEAFSEANIALFTNDSDLLNLAEFVRRLDLLISADTGTVHIADNLGVSVCEPIAAKQALRWGGGAYGGECAKLVLAKGWRKRYSFYKEKFFALARECVRGLK